MKFSSFRTVLSIAVVAITLMMTYGAAQVMAAGPDGTVSGQTNAGAAPVERVAENKTPTAAYKAGTLLKGSNLLSLRFSFPGCDQC